MAEAAAYSVQGGFGDRETVGDSFNYGPGFDYAAIGAFTGSAGLPSAAPSSPADFQAFVSAMEAKTTEISTTASHFQISGATHDYVLLGGTADDVLYGDLGDSGGGTFWGRDGNDSIIGGAGNDTIAPGAGNDTINGYAGTDTASYFDATTSVSVSLGLQGTAQATGIGLQTLTGFENLTGSAHGDVLFGDTNANVIDGGGGDNSLFGAGGDDTVSYASAGQGVHVSLAHQGSAQATGVGSQGLFGFTNLTGSAYADVLTGNASANVIDGGGGADTLTGAGGNDTLVSDGAGDKLIGGGGHDTFQFTAFTSPDLGVVSALSTGDVVDLTGAAASLGFSEFTAVAHFDHQAGEVRAEYNAATDRTVFLFDVDGDRRADFRLVVRGADTSDFSHFTGVDTSHLATDGTHDHGGLTV